MNTLSNDKPDSIIVGVSQLSTSIRLSLEKSFSKIQVKGEISGFTVAASGHAYFTLKEGKDTIACICWNGTRRKLSVQPKDGVEVICHGSVTAYSGQSKYQMIVNDINYHGAGSLMALLEKRKNMLLKEGVFDQSHKQILPKFPSTIGIITSESGAVIRDIIHRVRDRFPTRLILYPAAVQGDKSATMVAQGIEYFNQTTTYKPDVIIIARGGGSIEDLWSFNELEVIYAAHKSCIPIISAIGHETDFTLLDFVADVRAPTPTAAAELAVPDKRNIAHMLSSTKQRIDNILKKRIDHAEDKLRYLYRAIANPQFYLMNLSESTDNQYTQLLKSLKKLFGNQTIHVEQY